MKNRGQKTGKRYAHQVLAAINREGGRHTRKGFTGSNIDRGGTMGTLLANWDSFAAYRQRRVVIKARIVKLTGKGADRASVHLRYLKREDVTREGERGELHTAEHDQADGKKCLERSEGDWHQFRFIVAPEAGIEYRQQSSKNSPIPGVSSLS